MPFLPILGVSSPVVLTAAMEIGSCQAIIRSNRRALEQGDCKTGKLRGFCAASAKHCSQVAQGWSCMQRRRAMHASDASTLAVENGTAGGTSTAVIRKSTKRLSDMSAVGAIRSLSSGKIISSNTKGLAIQTLLRIGA